MSRPLPEKAPYADVMRAVAASTAPEPSAVRRVRRRLDVAVRSTGPLLSRVPPPSYTDVLKLRMRVRRRPSPRRRVPVLVPLAVIAAGALLTVVVGLYRAGESSPRPTEAVAVTLASGSAPVAIHPTREVSLVFTGNGDISGDSRDLKVAWESGDIAVEVEPNQGVHLQVQTGEATVQVVGTGFTVRRDALGTAVRVTHGIVEVDCSRGSFHRLYAGDATTCLPTSAGALLGRARMLQDQGASADDVLETVDLGLQTQPSKAVRGELLATKLSALSQLGRDEEALAAADDYLASGGPRVDEIGHAAATLAWQIGGCDRARPYLERIAVRTEEEAGRLASCENGGRSDP